MVYRLPSLSKYHALLHKFNVHPSYYDVETAFVSGRTISRNQRELYLIQKRPNNSGRVDSILLGYIDDADLDMTRHNRIPQTSHLARNLLDIYRDEYYPHNEFRYSWRCNYNGIILITRVRFSNGKVWLYQRRREGQTTNQDYRNNIICLGNTEHFESLFTYISLNILGQSPPGIPDEEMVEEDREEMPISTREETFNRFVQSREIRVRTSRETNE